MRFLILFLFLAVALHGQPQRIISTAPSITEILFALGVGDRVVGVTEYCRYPAEAKKLPRIGTWVTPHLETIVSLRPDLVIVQRTAVHRADKFRALHLRTLEVECLSVQDIFRSIESIGAAVGVPENARKLNARIHAQLDAVRNRVAGRPRTKVLFLVGRNPGTLEGLIAVGPGSYQSEVFDIAGGRNILADALTPYPKVLHEEILARDPDVIFDMGEHADADSISEPQKRRELGLWRRFPNIGAVRNGRVHILSSDLFVHPGPRVGEMAETFARMLHPEAFR